MKADQAYNLNADLLVLDDNALNVEVLVSLLEDQGFEQVEGMTDPRQLLPRVKKRRPDLIFLDIRMPYISGLQLLEQLGQLLGEQLPPVIVLTANTDADTRYRALQLGARDFLTKPFDHQEIIHRLENILGDHLRLKQQVFKADELEHLVAERTAELKRLAIEDPLTGLPNRSGLLEDLKIRLQQGNQLLVFFFALDGLEEMARLHGLEVSDNLALALRDRAQAQRQPGDLLGVWSSSEWVLIRQVDQPQQLTSEQLAKKTLPLLNAVRAPLVFQEFSLRPNVRIGVSAAGQDRSAETLVRLAALAVPEVQNTWRDYTPQLQEELQKKLTLQEALNHAAERGELHLAFQPKIRLADHSCSGAEVLLRWQSPVLGRVSPADFIPLAEKTGQILEIGRWVQEASCQQIKSWREQGWVEDDWTLAINVASHQLIQPDFASAWLAVLEAHQLPAHVLEIEVTESGLMENMQEALYQLTVLAEAGVSIAIDDFGTGYSSLAYLKTMPVSVLKIDRAFIVDMHTRSQDRELVQTIIQLAANLGFETVAEGVEEEEQVALLAQLGCQQIQGFYYSPPLQAKNLIEYLQQSSPF